MCLRLDTHRAALDPGAAAAPPRLLGCLALQRRLGPTERLASSVTSKGKRPPAQRHSYELCLSWPPTPRRSASAAVRARGLRGTTGLGRPHPSPAQPRSSLAKPCPASAKPLPARGDQSQVGSLLVSAIGVVDGALMASLTTPAGPKAGGRAARSADKSARAKLEELDAASLPLAQLAVAPVWLGTSPEVSALHATLRTLAEGSRQAGQGRLRVGVDTEWTDAATDEPSIPEPSVAAAKAASASVAADTTPRTNAPPRVAVVQVAVSDQVWVLDALAAGPETGALLQWALACDDVAVLGFAFSGDLAVLRPLCGGEGGELSVGLPAAWSTSSLVDVQTLAMRPGEDTPSLRRVCARTIGVRLDKTQQCSNWARRPLEQDQLMYAALDAQILLQVYEALLTREQ
eukprot:scaffold124981_cov78-Phaeocystis_antarctica.AAC.3